MLTPFDTPMCQIGLTWQWERKLSLFWLTWWCFVVLQGAILPFENWKESINLKGKWNLSPISFIAPVNRRRENREKKKAIRRSTVAFIVRPSIRAPPSLSYFVVYAKLCMFSHPLLVWNLVFVFIFQISFVSVFLLLVFAYVFCSCLKMVSWCAFWLLVSMCSLFMFKNHILVCILVGGLHLCFV